MMIARLAAAKQVRLVAGVGARCVAARGLSGTPQSSSYQTRTEGPAHKGFALRNEEDYRVFVEDGSGKVVSPWHDIPAIVDASARVVNFVNEIPRGAVEKMEVATKEESNPIKQDVKKGKLRLYPFQSLVNYGCIPQTWEDPEHQDPSTGMLGDNDPVDVCEVGSRVRECGEVYPVKVLGILGMIDEGEMDWKVLAIATDDPDAGSISTVEDLERHKPGMVDNIVSWFKHYKEPDGKPENEFAFDGKAQDGDFAMDIISQTHDSWKNTENIHKAKLWK